MEFSLEFYVTSAGSCPVKEFLEELKQTDPGDFAAVLAGLAKLRDRRYHAEQPCLKNIASSSAKRTE